MSESSKTSSHKEKVYRYVKDSVIADALRPGDKIRERDIAELLGVSRTPVREAIQALQRDGWVKVVPRRGTIVQPLLRVDVEEVLQLRLIVGPAALRIGAGNVSSADLAYYESLLRKQEEAAAVKDAVAFLDADMALHAGFVKLAGNRRLMTFTRQLCDLFQRIGIQSLVTHQRFYEAIEEHRGIVAALAAGNSQAAVDRLVAHLSSTKAVLLRLIEQEAGAQPPAFPVERTEKTRRQ